MAAQLRIGGDDGIDQHGAVGTAGFSHNFLHIGSVPQDGKAARQMSACGEAADADMLRIDAQLFGMAAYIGHGLCRLQQLGGEGIAAAARHAVVQHKAVVVVGHEGRSDGLSLPEVRKMLVSAAGADDQRLADVALIGPGNVSIHVKAFIAGIGINSFDLHKNTSFSHKSDLAFARFLAFTLLSALCVSNNFFAACSIT